MNRLLLATVAVAVVAVIGFGVFVVTSGGPRQSPLVVGTPLGSGTQAPGESAAPADEPVADAVDDGAASERLAAWEERVRARGFTVEAGRSAIENDTLTVADLDLSAPDWRWTASSASVGDHDATGFEITASGSQKVFFTFDGEDVELFVNTEETNISVGDGEGGVSGVTRLAFTNLSITAGDNSSPITLASGELQIMRAEGDEVLPEASQARVRLRDLVLSGMAGTVLGTDIRSLSTTAMFRQPLTSADPNDMLEPLVGNAKAIELRDLRLAWGSLELAGNGAIGLDDVGRPAGQFDVRVPEVLAFLDAVRILGLLDRDAMANAFAAVLLADGRTSDVSGLPFKLAIADGRVTLSDPRQDFDDITFAEVQPVQAPHAAE